MGGLTIGKFAAAEGVGVETVRFYHRRGLLALRLPVMVMVAVTARRWAKSRGGGVSAPARRGCRQRRGAARCAGRPLN